MRERRGVRIREMIQKIFYNGLELLLIHRKSKSSLLNYSHTLVNDPLAKDFLQTLYDITMKEQGVCKPI